jgi:energy-coupling factor transporter ATP-binding protein EcfA2
MEQDPDMAGSPRSATLPPRLPPGEEYRVARVAEGLRFDPGASVATASGGERRRAALARLMAAEPELMLLDEPTNHLDITAIGWLEEELQATRAAVVLISHDRAFLRALTRTTLWLDRGELRRNDRGFSDFEAWRDRLWAEEDDAAPQARTEDQGRGEMGGGGHQRPAQAQPGPSAGARGAARGAGGDDPPAGRGGDGVRGRRQDRQEGHRGAQRYFKDLRREDDPVGILVPGRAGRPGGLRGSRTAWARRRF